MQRRSHPKWRSLAALTALQLVFACQKPPMIAAKPPDPGFNGDQLRASAVDTGRIRRYLNQLHFDSVLGAADRQRVDFVRQTLGESTSPWAVIQPLENAHALTDAQLVNGAFIARVWSDSSYPPLEFGPWWTYWWVDSTGVTWHSVFIPDSLGVLKPGKTSSKPMQPPEAHPGHYWRQGIAQFRTRSSVYGWGDCGGYCCEQQLSK